MLRPLIACCVGAALVCGCGHVGVNNGHSQAIAETELDAAEAQVARARELSAAGDPAGAASAYRAALELISADELPERVRPRAEALADLVLEEYHLLLSAMPSLPDETPAWAVMAELDSSAASVATYSLHGDDVTYDMPVVINDKVAGAIAYFMNKGRKPFTVWLERIGLYEDIIRPILREHGLPQDLIYLAMIESGFNTRAQSYARAVGPWQFIAGTARRYDLRITPWVDERRDIVKSTHAACRYLKDLHAQFGSWELAMAAYNCGEGKVERHIKRHKTDDYWKLTRLPRQTRGYVPTFMAAMIIAKSPHRYGFAVEPLPALEWDVVELEECTSVDVAARCAGGTVEELELLNAELRRGCTPPNERYALRLPKGTAAQFALEYAKIPDSEKVTWAHHRVRRGETLSIIARHYGTTVDAIKEMNNLRSTHMIREGAELVIPIPRGSSVARGASSERHEETICQVRRGDTLGRIASRHGITVGQLCEWNGLSTGTVIHPGQTLRLGPAVSPPKPRVSAATASAQASATTASGIRYTVKPGDTLGLIAQRHGVTVGEIRRANGIRGSLIRAGQTLVIPGKGGSVVDEESPVRLAQAPAVGQDARAGVPARQGDGPSAEPSSQATGYTVRRGDSLSRIATRFGVSVEAIRKMNGLRSTVIHPGQRLTIPARHRVGSVYVVRRGDSLSAIARRFGVDQAALEAMNSITGESVLYPGTTLAIPPRADALTPSMGG